MISIPFNLHIIFVILLSA